METQDSDRCDVCGKEGKAAERCRFDVCCSCWYGVPCERGESMREHDRNGGE